MMDMDKILTELSKDRPIFHSEADFQHALAWKIHEKYPDFNIRLEKGMSLDYDKIYFDIFIQKNGNIIIIETKYKTKEIDITVGNEIFNLAELC